MIGGQAIHTRRSHRWTPAVLGASGVAFWIDARRETFANNDPVGTATDWSGNGRNATQSVAGAKPTFKTGIFKSATLPGFYFDGGDCLVTGAFSLQDSGCAFVGKMTTQGMYCEHGTAYTNDTFFFYDNNATYFRGNGTGSGFTQVNAGVGWLGTSEVLAAGYFINPTVHVRKNGTELGNASGAQTYSASNALNVGSRDNAASLQCTGYFGEMVVLNTPTADNILKVEGYLAWDWGLVSLLPADHQWKYAPPNR